MLTKLDERRLYTRVVTSLPVRVYCERILLTTCRSINVSVGGVCLQTNDLGLIQNNLVEVEFCVDELHTLYNVRIPCLVVRSDACGLALAFENIEKGTEELIKENSLYTFLS
jgi:hypothetical protein